MERKLDELGRIVIPRQIRELLGLQCGDAVQLDIIDNRIVIKKIEQV